MIRVSKSICIDNIFVRWEFCEFFLRCPATRVVVGIPSLVFYRDHMKCDESLHAFFFKEARLATLSTFVWKQNRIEFDTIVSTLEIRVVRNKC